MPDIKAAVWGGIAILLLLLGLGVWYFYHQNQDLKKDVTVKTIENQDQKNVAEVKEKADGISEDSRVQTQNDTAAVKETAAVISHKADVAVSKVKDSYKDKPVTSDNTKQKDDAISMIRIRALLDQYCVEHPDYTACVKQEVAK